MKKLVKELLKRVCNALAIIMLGFAGAIGVLFSVLANTEEEAQLWLRELPWMCILGIATVMALVYAVIKTARERVSK